MTPPPSTSSAVAIIPARLGSTRFPAKALADDTGTPLVVHVCQQAAKANSITRVVVATDAREIRDAAESHGFDAVMTADTHPNGTSRIGEAVNALALTDDHIVVNVQGDEPEIEPGVIDAAAATITDPSATGAGTVATPITDAEDLDNPNVVKVARALDGRALYFSRSRIPHPRSAPDAPALRHVGIYAYTAGSIRAYLALNPTPLEAAESLEQLRWLEHGHPVAVAIHESSHAGIDTPEQYAAFVKRHNATKN